MPRYARAAWPLCLVAVGCSTKFEGPSPKVDSVAPSPICLAQNAVSVTIAGSGFSPIVADALTSAPRVVMPTVSLVNAMTPVEVPAAGVSLPVKDGTALSVSIPSGLVGPKTATEPEAKYDVTVKNANGHEFTLPAALTVVPPPTLTDVQPVEICNGIGSKIVLTGTNFRAGATVEIGTSPVTKVSAADVNVMGATMAEVTVKPGAMVGGPFDVTITNPEEGACAATKTMALTIEAPPTLTRIEPQIAPTNTIVDPFTLVGTTFLPGMTVSIDALSPAVATATVIDRMNATARMDLAGVPARTTPYDVTIKNVDGCSFTLKGAFTVTAAKPIQVAGIDPPFGCTCERTTVTIKGADFVSTPIVDMRKNGDAAAPIIRFERVAFIDATTLTAVVPKGSAVGDYDVTVTNPPTDGGQGTLVKGFRVVENPVPQVFSVDPGRGTTGADRLVTVNGANFRNQVQFELLTSNGTAVFTSAPIAVDPSPNTSFQVTIPIQSQASPALTEGVYLVRVTNLDENTFSTFSFFVIKNPSAKLSPFSPGITLEQPRRELAAVQAVDDLGNKYVYAVGGANATDALDTVEVSALSKFGDLGKWTVQPNPLKQARRGVALVAVPVFRPNAMGIDLYVPQKTYLYAVGGRDGTTIHDTVERAVILRNADAPVASGEAMTGVGALLAGTWYYKVSAVLSDGDLDNKAGETLPSDEVIVTLFQTGSIKLSWPQVMVNGMAAAKYRIYRTDTPNGTSQTEHLIDEVTALEYADMGKAAGTASFLSPGSTGVWSEQPAKLKTKRFGVSALLAQDPAGARFIYVIGGRSEVTGGFLQSVEVIPVDALGATGNDFSLAQVDTGGDATLLDSRAFAGADIETRSNVSTFSALPTTRLWMAGGVGQEGGTGAIKALIGLEFADVKAGGTLTAWAHQKKGGSAEYDITAAAGPFFAISSDQLFSVGGAGTADDTSFAGVLDGPGDKIDFGGGGALTGAASSSTNGPPTPMALGATIRSTGLLYFIGGTSTGTDAITTTYRAIN